MAAESSSTRRGKKLAKRSGVWKDFTPARDDDGNKTKAMCNHCGYGTSSLKKHINWHTKQKEAAPPPPAEAADADDSNEGAGAGTVPPCRARGKRSAPTVRGSIVGVAFTPPAMSPSGPDDVDDHRGKRAHTEVAEEDRTQEVLNLRDDDLVVGEVPAESEQETPPLPREPRMPEPPPTSHSHKVSAVENPQQLITSRALETIQEELVRAKGEKDKLVAELAQTKQALSDSNKALEQLTQQQQQTTSEGLYDFWITCLAASNPNKSLLESYTSYTLRYLSVTVHLYGIHKTLRSVDLVDKIIEKIGDKDKSVVLSESSMFRAQEYVLARVILDVTKPLLDSVTISLSADSKIKVYVHYEKLVKICTFCGHLFHNASGCLKKQQIIWKLINPSEAAKVSDDVYGKWRSQEQEIPLEGREEQKSKSHNAYIQSHNATTKRALADLQEKSQRAREQTDSATTADDV